VRSVIIVGIYSLSSMASNVYRSILAQYPHQMEAFDALLRLDQQLQFDSLDCILDNVKKSNRSSLLYPWLLSRQAIRFFQYERKPITVVAEG